MKTISFNIDYSYCPKGHSWIFISQSTLYSDIFWCEDCDLFYYPSVKPLTQAKLNENFSSDRAYDIIKLAKFKKWKDTLSLKDMPKE